MRLLLLTLTLVFSLGCSRPATDPKDVYQQAMDSLPKFAESVVAEAKRELVEPIVSKRMRDKNGKATFDKTGTLSYDSLYITFLDETSYDCKKGEESLFVPVVGEVKCKAEYRLEIDGRHISTNIYTLSFKCHYKDGVWKLDRPIKEQVPK